MDLDWLVASFPSLSTLMAVAVGIGLSASAGFRIFLPLLVAAIAARLGWLPLQGEFAWIGTTPAIIAFATAAAAEIAAYYIPFVDNLLDTIASPLAVAAGGLMMTSLLPVDNDLLKWTLGLIAGGGTAAAVQGGTVLTRLAATKLTAGLGNGVLSTGENVLALGGSLSALFLPFITAGSMLLLIGYLLFRFGAKLFSRRNDSGRETDQGRNL